MTGVSLSNDVFMKIITWNCRGASSPRFFRNLKELVKKYNPTVLVLLETRTTSAKANRILNSFHFSKLAAVEAAGFKGGIWCFWDDTQICMEVINFDFQYLTLGVITNTKVQWVISMIYASPEIQNSAQLWRSLESMGSCMDFPWVIIRDCNEVLSQTDKCDGRKVIRNGRNELGRFIN